MTPADKVAAVCVGAGCASVNLADILAKADSVLHTLTLLAGFCSAIAACVYYWTNRRITKTTKTTTTETTTAKREPEAPPVGDAK